MNSLNYYINNINDFLQNKNIEQITINDIEKIYNLYIKSNYKDKYDNYLNYNCNNCNNCILCDNCDNCDNCILSSYCNNCNNCNKCINCDKCVNCNNCKNINEEFVYKYEYINNKSNISLITILDEDKLPKKIFNSW